MRCAKYIRVSTHLQEKKFSLAAQQLELEEYAKKQGWKIIGEFKDVETGGKLNKKGLSKMLDLVEDGRIDVVLCIDQDRLSRLDTVAWEYLKSTLRDNNVKIAEPGTITDLGDEDQEFISDIKNLIARREKKSIVKRMMRGKRQRLREGKPWGKPPIGYTYNKETSTFHIDEKWAWVIPMIDRLYLEEQLGMKTIAHKLNEVSRTPRGTLWNETLVFRRLVSKAFHGVMEKKFSNGETIEIENIYPPLRTKETYERIQEERKKRGTIYKATSRRRENLNILRRTLVTCGLCGRKLSLQQNSPWHDPNYYLKHGRKQMGLKEEAVCDISVNTKRFEPNLIKAIKDILTDESFAMKYINLETTPDDLTELKQKTSIAKKNMQAVQEKIDRLLDLYLDGKFSKEQLDQRQKQLEIQLNQLEEEYKQATAKLEAYKRKEWNYETIYAYLEIAKDFDTDLTHLERAQLLGSLFPKAILYKEKIVLIGTINEELPLEIEIPIELDRYLWHHSKKKKGV
ncbi:recombinase family protein [Evansella clarkii]|uniref:recombinase family protein n=1 Tax=Evansella clarkii TaxID=79879 RepID=UPI000998A204|nr:recombinase family protein [Evansella clarkii]